MLIELVQPLQDALHFVAGDGPGLKRASENFTEIGKGFVTLADQFVTDGDEALKDWQGEGGDAAKKALAQFSPGIKGIGTAAGAVADTLQMWPMVMTTSIAKVASVVAKVTKTRAALFGDAAKEAAESLPKKLYEETVKEVTGSSPGDLSKGPGSQGKAAYKIGSKIVDYAKNPSVGDGKTAEETRDNLDMGE